MDLLAKLSNDPRVTVRRAGSPDPDGVCVVYWMQRAQRGLDNPALDVAIQGANVLGKPVVVFFAPVPYYPHANLRHYRFLNEGIPDIAEACADRNVGFVLRRYPEHSLVTFCEEVKAALVVGDENPMREPEGWRRKAVRNCELRSWTVDADVIVPSRLLEKARTLPTDVARGCKNSSGNFWLHRKILSLKLTGRGLRTRFGSIRNAALRRVGSWIGRLLLLLNGRAAAERDFGF